MIVYDGIRQVSTNLAMLRFTNESGKIVEIPIDEATANRIGKYLVSLSKPNEPLEIGNDDPSE